MSLLFTQEWDVLRGKEDAYAEFVAKTFIPKCQEVGLRPVGGFYVEVGVGPKIISLKSVETLEDLYRAISSQQFRTLINELKGFVTDYRSKILEPLGLAKTKPYSIQRGVWKYNQYYNLIPHQRKEYADFVVNEYLPTMKQLDYVHVTGGWNVLIGGPSEVISEFTFKDPADIGMMLGNDDFRKLTSTLLSRYAAHHTSRIMRTTERFEEPKWFRL